MEVLDNEVVEKQHNLASKGSRFTNHIIDTLAQMGIVFGVTYAMAYYNQNVISEDGPFLFDYVFGAVIGILYYTTLEYFLKGKSLGKFVTGTRAVTTDFERIPLSKVLLRSATRMVPFEAFSFLGADESGWHDRWTDTCVIKDTEWVDRDNIW